MPRGLPSQGTCLEGVAHTGRDAPQSKMPQAFSIKQPVDRVDITFPWENSEFLSSTGCWSDALAALLPGKVLDFEVAAEGGQLLRPD